MIVAIYIEIVSTVLLISSVNSAYKADTVALFTLTNCDQEHENQCEVARFNERAMRIAHVKNNVQYKLCTIDVKNKSSIVFETAFSFLESNAIDMTGQCLNTNDGVVFHDKINQTIFFTFMSFELTRFLSSIFINTDFGIIAITEQPMYPAPLLEQEMFVYSYESSYDLEAQKENIQRIKSKYNISYIGVIYLEENEHELNKKSCTERPESAFCFYINQEGYEHDCFKEKFVDLKNETSVQNAVDLIIADSHMRIIIVYGYDSMMSSFPRHKLVLPYYRSIFFTMFTRRSPKDFQITQHEVPENGWYSLKVIKNVPGEYSINWLLTYTFLMQRMFVYDTSLFTTVKDSGVLEKYEAYLHLFVPNYNNIKDFTIEKWRQVSISTRSLIASFVLRNQTNVKLLLQYWKKAHYYATADTDYLLTLPTALKKALDAKPYCNLTKPRCNKGQQLEHSLYKESKWENSYGFHCTECPSNTFKEVEGNDACQPCLYPYKTSNQKTICYDPFNDFYITSHYGGATPAFVLSILTSLVILFTAGTFIYYRNTPVVKLANKKMTTLQLLSHFFLGFAPLFLFIGRPNQTSCFLKPIFIGIGFTITMSVNLSKTQKVYMILNRKTRLNKVEVKRLEFWEWVIILAFLLMDIGILITTFIKKVPEMEYIYHNLDLTREVTCNNNDEILIHLAFLLLLTLGNCVQAFRVRKLPSHFRETVHVIYLSFISVLMLPVVAVIYFSQDTLTEKNMVLLVSIELLNTVHFSLIYFYKMYILLFKRGLNTKELLKRSR